MKIGYWLLVAGLVFVGSSVRGEEAHDPAKLGFVKGVTWGWVGSRGEYASPEAAASMQKLADTGADWVCIAFAPAMQTHDTPEIRFSADNQQMVTDDEIRHAIELANQNSLKIILKPTVNCRDGVWRSWIRFFRPVTDEEKAAGITGEMDVWCESPHMRDGEVKDREAWDKWWEDYTNYLVHYARIAEEEKVPALCLGCEMGSTEEFEDKWRALIAEVRKVYSGQITYNLNHGRENDIPWLDALDFISVSAYHPIPVADGRPLEEAVKETTSLAEIKAAMEPIRERMRGVVAKFGKPILFIETGCTSVRGCAHTPWEHIGATRDRPVDQQEQANYYQAQLETYWDEPWFMGWCWWDWPARLYDKSEAAANRDFCPYGKQAEGVLREWYAKSRDGAVATQQSAAAAGPSSKD
jgi:hypothetical protein